MANFELTFTFQPVRNSIKFLYDKIVVQLTGIPNKLILWLFSKFIYKSVKYCITEGKFIGDFQKAGVRLFYNNEEIACK